MTVGQGSWQLRLCTSKKRNRPKDTYDVPKLAPSGPAMSFSTASHRLYRYWDSSHAGIPKASLEPTDK